MYFFLMIIFGIIVAVVAKQKDREVFLWFLYGALLFPIALIHILVVDTETETGGKFRKCPFCAEHIKSEAKVCRFCGRDVEPLVKPPVNSKLNSDSDVIICKKCTFLTKSDSDYNKYYCVKTPDKKIIESGYLEKKSRPDWCPGGSIFVPCIRCVYNERSTSDKSIHICAHPEIISQNKNVSIYDTIHPLWCPGGIAKEFYNSSFRF